MKKIKIVLSVVLILAMSMLFVACGDNNEGESSSGVPIPEGVEVKGNVEGESTLPATFEEAVERIKAEGYTNEVLNTKFDENATDAGKIGMAVYYDATSTYYMEVHYYKDAATAMGGYLQRDSQKTAERQEVVEIHGNWVIVALPDAIEAFVG